MKKRAVFHPALRRVAAFAVAVAFIGSAAAQRPTIPANGYDGLPEKVDLMPFATVGLPGNASVIRDQGARNSCTVFGAVGALEIEYNRAGLGQLDLSEEFLTSIGSQGYVHPIWEDHQRRYRERGDAGFKENKISFCSGGGGTGQLENLTQIKIPTEADWRYRANSPLMKFCGVDIEEFDPDAGLTRDEWNSIRNQRNINDVNFRAIPGEAITAPLYYGVETFTLFQPNGREPAITYAAALAEGHPVVFDTRMDMFSADADGVMRENPAGRKSGSHSMLLVGYDFSDPNDKIAIVRNSWGPASGPNGTWLFDFEDLTANIYGAGIINAVSRPEPRPEYAYIGRWDVVFDGHKGVLEITKMPGFNQQALDMAVERFNEPQRTDRRVGIFYPAGDGEPLRVNGNVTADALTFYIDGENPNLPFDSLSGRRFEYRLIHPGLMAGTHIDPNGSEWGGYAVRTEIAVDLPAGQRADVVPASLPARELKRETLPATYKLYTDQEYATTLSIGQVRQNGFMTNRGEGYFLDQDGGGRRIHIKLNADGSRYLELSRLSRQPGVMAGYVKDARDGSERPALAVLTSGVAYQDAQPSQQADVTPGAQYVPNGGMERERCSSGTVRVFGSDGEEYIIHDGEEAIVPASGVTRLRWECGGRSENQKLDISRGTDAIRVVKTGRDREVQVWPLKRVVEATVIRPTGRAETRTFIQPTVNGIRLDWCRVWGNECGKPAADAFCTSQGFRNAADHPIDANIGRTWVMGDARECNDPNCDGFTRIVCE